jgi:RNA polymerase primary sigma factor
MTIERSVSGESETDAGYENVEFLAHHARLKRLLTAEEEIQLARRVEAGDLRAREEMIESNLRLVFAIARGYRGRGVPFADLVQEGNIGLVLAVERFDHRRGLKFSTYAVWWIRRSLLDAVAGSRMIRVPAKANQQLAAIRRAEAEIGSRASGRPRAEAIAERTGLSPRAVQSLRATAQVTTSLEEPIGEDMTALGELMADDCAEDPSERVIAHEARREVSDMLRLLPARHREVVTRRYGLNRNRAQSHEEIGRCLGVGVERSRKIEREALHRLRTIVRPEACGATRSGLLSGAQ